MLVSPTLFFISLILKILLIGMIRVLDLLLVVLMNILILKRILLNQSPLMCTLVKQHVRRGGAIIHTLIPTEDTITRASSTLLVGNILEP